MLSTSLKSMDEIRQGSLLAMPFAPNFAAWAKAWSRPAPAPTARA
jgi:glucose/mannose transport system permease protein